MYADEIPPAIQWHEGMLLTPHHFQQSSARGEMLLQYTSLAAAPYAWGVRRLQFDQRLLKTGTYRVLELEAILADGSVVSHRAERDPELTVDLSPFKESMRTVGVAVHLALPARSTSGAGALSRYRSVDGDPVPDENTGDGEQRIPRLRPSLTLFAGDAPPPKYESFPLARVRFEDENFYLADYVPASLAVARNSELALTCARLVSRVREKAIFISEQARSPASVLDMPQMLDSRLRVQTLVAGLPALEALLATGAAHPFTVFLTLCNLAGFLCSLGGTLLPPVFSAYRHDDPLAGFSEVAAFCHRMIDEGVPETYRALPFRYADGVFSLPFEPAWSTSRLVLGMRVPGGSSEREVVSWGEECLIGGDEIIQSLRERRILGAQRQFTDRDGELVPVRGVVLFTLRPDDFVRPGQTLQILNFSERPGSVRPLEIVLYVKQGK